MESVSSGQPVLSRLIVIPRGQLLNTVLNKRKTKIKLNLVLKILKQGKVQTKIYTVDKNTS